MERFDIIVIGGGHAGAEAAWAASKGGLAVALFTLNLDTIGKMSCSPSIGGLAKSHLVKEIDALGGIMAEVADETAIQYRLLNTKKGPAVQATRTQNDRWRYAQAVKSRLERAGIHLRQAKVCSLVVHGGSVQGVIDQTGTIYEARAVIVAAGTFLDGTIHIGQRRIPAGRAGEEGSHELSAALMGLGLCLGRHKTGTPPRLHRDSLDFTALTRQEPEEGLLPFAFSPAGPPLKQVPCFTSRTTAETHRLVRENIHLSPLYSGAITGTPARYCPSLEDKVMHFGDRDGHQVMLEPEGLDTQEIYASGLGNSLPLELQWQIVHSVPGLERAEILRPAYAIEYNYILPTQIDRTLETRAIRGLFLAGQVNGTSGYEEAAAQGLMAGLNASLSLRGREPFILERSQAYIGVMLDDLTARGTSEPYRMFTSRAEYRLMLRESNALLRLSRQAFALGLIAPERMARVEGLEQEISALKSHLERVSITIPDDLPKIRPTRGAARERVRLQQLLKRPEVGMQDLASAGLLPPGAHPLSLTECAVDIKYAGYIERQLRQIEHLRTLEQVCIPVGVDYGGVEGLSTELKQRLSRLRPATLGQASRIEGMTPAALEALHIMIRATCSSQPPESRPAS